MLGVAWVLMVSLALNVAMDPWSSQQLSRMENASFASLTATFSLLTFLYFPGIERDPALSVLVVAAMMVINVATLVVFAGVMVWGARETLFALASQHQYFRALYARLFVPSLEDMRAANQRLRWAILDLRARLRRRHARAFLVAESEELMGTDAGALSALVAEDSRLAADGCPTPASALLKDPLSGCSALLSSSVNTVASKSLVTQGSPHLEPGNSEVRFSRSQGFRSLVFEASVQAIALELAMTSSAAAAARRRRRGDVVHPITINKLACDFLESVKFFSPLFDTAATEDALKVTFVADTAVAPVDVDEGDVIPCDDANQQKYLPQDNGSSDAEHAVQNSPRDVSDGAALDAFELSQPFISDNPFGTSVCELRDVSSSHDKGQGDTLPNSVKSPRVAMHETQSSLEQRRAPVEATGAASTARRVATPGTRPGATSNVSASVGSRRNLLQTRATLSATRLHVDAACDGHEVPGSSDVTFSACEPLSTPTVDFAIQQTGADGRGSHHSIGPALIRRGPHVRGPRARAATRLQQARASLAALHQSLHHHQALAQMIPLELEAMARVSGNIAVCQDVIAAVYSSMLDAELGVFQRWLQVMRQLAVVIRRRQRRSHGPHPLE